MRKAPLVGLLGVLVAVMSAQLNDLLTTTAIADIGGEAGIGNDVSTWLPTLYVTGEITGMAVAPTLSLIFTLRRFALFAIGLSLVPTLLIPFCRGPEPLLGLRLMQGFAGGLTIPLLMTLALRVLAPAIRLYGLAAYALSATFAPNLANSLAALWIDRVEDYRFVFFEAVPFAAVAAVCIWWGADQDPPRYAMLRKFDWPGALLVGFGFGSLAIALEQGDRLDWFNSPVICVFLLAAVVAVPLLIVRELTAAQPLFLLPLLKDRNFAYGVIALILFLVIALSGSQVPLTFLERVRGYRPLQAQLLTLEIALSQLIFLPLAAVLLNYRRVDSRWLSFAGLLAILVACIGAARLDSSWSRDEFFGWQLLQSFGSAFVI
ncbi:MFS transporter, partial [Sphingomonas bacterium]|uniref:MFS transporter n=1 Tax=Sphingomonas bacterium TaxID=1895847 RepID=UPI001575BAC2